MTGTRSFNTPGMVEYENQIAKYLRRTENHVRYRVTPDFRGNELVARGIQMEAQSIEVNDFGYTRKHICQVAGISKYEIQKIEE